MVKIGLTEWFVGAWERSLPYGQVELSLVLTPQAKVYHATQYVNFWQRSTANVATQTFFVKRVESSYMCPEEKAHIVQQMASSLACEVVRWCSNQGLIRGHTTPFDHGICEALIDCCQRAAPEEIQQVEFIDLVDQEQRLEHERQLRVQAAWEHQHNTDIANREPSTEVKVAQEAQKRSYDLLCSWLTKEERQEAAARGLVTVKNELGEWSVPVTVPGMVTRKVKGQAEGRYCVLFKDSRLPLGDEALMKVALLKTDPKVFIEKANRFDPAEVSA